jgi:hypothetical protein
MPYAKKDLDVASVVVVAVVGVLLVVALVVALEGLFYSSQDAAFQVAAAQPVLEVKKAKAEQRGLLENYLVPESGKGTLHVPIDRAITLVAQDGAAGPGPAVESPAPPAASPKLNGEKARRPAPEHR